MQHSQRQRSRWRSSLHGPNRWRGVSKVEMADLVERIVFVLIAAVLVALAATIVALVVGWDGAILFTWFQRLQSQPVEGGMLAAFLVLGAVYFVVAAFRSEGERIVRWRGDLGAVDISVQAVEDLAAQAAANVSGVKDLRVRVDVIQDRLRVKVDTYVLPERSIPELATDVQSRVSSYVQEIVGIPVEDCIVRVRGIDRRSHQGKVE